MGQSSNSALKEKQQSFKQISLNGEKIFWIHVLDV